VKISHVIEFDYGRRRALTKLAKRINVKGQTKIFKY